MNRLFSLTNLTTFCCIAHFTPANAQLVPDNTLGTERSVVTPNVNIRDIPSDTPNDTLHDRIDGGAVRGSNLFHSFQEFNVEAGRGVYFTNPDSIVNILTRVTGDNISNILGTLGVLGNANLFLINPNGIVFGPNARLDVGGSFFASTADSILFENGIEFAASNPQAPPLLTINIPLGLNIRENPGNIVVRRSNDENFAGLEVPDGTTLGFVGGDIQVEGGLLTAPQGRVELGSVAGNSIVSLTPIAQGYALSYEGVQNFRDISLSQAAFVDVQGDGGGDVQVQGRRVTLTEGSAIQASTQGSEFGGIVAVRASESVEVIGGETFVEEEGFESGIFADVESGATGEGGSIIIDTQRLFVRDGALISTATLGEGDAGNLTVTATDVELVGTDVDGFPSGLFASVGLPAESGVTENQTVTGNAGDLTINTQRLFVRDGAQILTDTFAQGNAGNLTITATDVELIGANSTISTNVEQSAIGNGGNLTINTQRLFVRDGAFISTATLGKGNAGNLTITATDVELVGTDIDGFPSGLFTSVGLPAKSGVTENQTVTGNAGDLTLNTQSLRVGNGADISTATFGNGNAGDLTVTATDVKLIGTSSEIPRGLSAFVGENARGNAGNVTLNTQRLQVQNGANISTATLGQGDAGSVNLQAEEINLTGASSVSADVVENATGNAGTITVNTENLSVQEQSLIVVSSEGLGNPGNLQIRASQIRLDTQGGLVAISETGRGGNIQINSPDIRLRHQSEISASGSERGQTFEGNIEMNTNLLLLLEESKIITDAFDPAGGSNILIRPLNTSELAIVQSQNSIINAAGELSIDTTLNFDTLEVLKVEVVDLTALIAQTPCQQGEDSEFIITGRGGLPPNPTQGTRQRGVSLSLTEPVQPASRIQSHSNRQRSRNRDLDDKIQPLSSDEIIPARGWIRNQQGEVILVGYDPTGNSPQRQLDNSRDCSNP